MMPGQKYEMSGTTEKPVISSVTVKTTFPNGSVKMPEKGTWKSKLMNDLWCKITLLVAIVVLVILVTYRVAQGSTSNSSKRNETLTNSSKTNEERFRPVPTTDTRETVRENSTVDLAVCVEGSIENSRSSFTFQPYGKSLPYRTNGLEFSFEVLVKKVKLEKNFARLNETTAASAKIHYYYNIDRCRIGGGLQIHKKPYVRGPIVFAINQECSKVYYFSQRSGWIKYRSARNINCSSHGKRLFPTSSTKSISECVNGSIGNSRSSFTFQPYGSQPYRATGLEFSFEVVVKKTNVESTFTELNKTAANSSNIHYYYNIDRCRIGGGIQIDKQPYIRGPMTFAVDQECTKVYYFREGSGWIKYKSARNITCSSHGRQYNFCTDSAPVGKSEGQPGREENLSATFQFFTSGERKKQKVHGIRHHFAAMLRKLSSLITDINLASVPRLNSTDVSYYLNLDRCLNGGPVNMDVTPQIRGPLVFAVSNNCSSVHYFSTSRVSWVTYKSAFNIVC